MDIITKSHFDEFKKNYGYTSSNDSEVFELFAIYCITSKYVKSETISKSVLEEIKIGNGGDWGIDGFLIIVNGKIVTTEEIIKDLLDANGSISVQIVLIQAKISERFDSSELGVALDGIEYIMKDILQQKKLPCSNKDLTKYRNLVKFIYSHSSDFTDGKNPIVHGYYVCCGNYNNHADFESKRHKTIDFVKSTDLADEFDYFIIDRKDITKAYKDTKVKAEVTINIEQKITLPKVNNISDAYLCILPFVELKKLFISDDKIIQDVFNDNVRAFQGLNLVNKDITESLKAGNIDLFTAMNNGITVIAKRLHPTGHDIRLQDYQIVNGCQTCNVLYLNRNLLGIDNLKVVVKLIASEDKSIRDKIIVGNNSQTEVKREQLVSLLECQKQIEDYYNAQNKYERLYYERRSKQYRSSDSKVPVYKVITIPNQILSFVSMILGEPDKVSRYYGSIVEEFDKNGKKVFSPKNNPALYYTCALASFKMTELFSNGYLDKKYKKVKFHVLLAFRLMCEEFALPPLNSNKTQDYCDALCERLSDTKKCEQGFGLAKALVDMALGREPYDSDRMKKAFTNKIKKLAALSKE